MEISLACFTLLVFIHMNLYSMFWRIIFYLFQTIHSDWWLIGISIFLCQQIVPAPWRRGGHKRTCHQVNTQHSVSKNMPSPAYHWCSHSAVMPVMTPASLSLLLPLFVPSSTDFTCPTHFTSRQARTGSLWTVFTSTTTGRTRLFSTPLRFTPLLPILTTASTSAAYRNMTPYWCPALTLTARQTGTSLSQTSRWVTGSKLAIHIKCGVRWRCVLNV